MKCTKCGQFGHALNLCAYVPSARKGQDNGGIRDLAGIKDRCRINDETGCWEWAGASSSNSAKRKSTIPVAWSPAHGKVMTVTRLAMEFSRDMALGKRRVWRTCGGEDCVNPAHLKFGTHAEWGAWMKKTEVMKGKVSIAVRRAVRISRGDVKTTMELAVWARESEQMGLDVAHALDISPKQVSRIRKFHTWKPTVSGASVFSWRPA